MFTKHLPHSWVSLNVIRKMQTNLDGIFKVRVGLVRVRAWLSCILGPFIIFGFQCF